MRRDIHRFSLPVSAVGVHVGVSSPLLLSSESSLLSAEQRAPAALGEISSLQYPTMQSYLSAKKAREDKFQEQISAYQKAAASLEDEWKKLEKGHVDLEAKKAALEKDKKFKNS